MPTAVILYWKDEKEDAFFHKTVEELSAKLTAYAVNEGQDLSGVSALNNTTLNISSSSFSWFR